MNKLFKTDGHGIIIGCTNGIENIKNLIIPFKIDGEVITGIGAYAFGHCDELISVTIPDTVTEIGRCAFEYCTSLKSIIIPDSVTKIGKGAFNTCKSLECVVLPEGIQEIENGMFSRCSSLRYISIPASVTKIGGEASMYCESLDTVYFKGTRLDWSVMDIGSLNRKIEDHIVIKPIES